MKVCSRKRWCGRMLVVALLGGTVVSTRAGLAQEESADATADGASESRQPAELRTWRDRSGKYSVEAELVDVEEDRVRLRRADGTVVSVPLVRLSESDREYVVRAMHDRGDAHRPVVEVDYMPPPAEEDRKIYDALREPVSLSFRNIGPADLGDLLEAEFDVPVAVRGAVDGSVTLSADEQNVPLETTLNRIFAGTQLGYIVADGALVILPRADIERDLIERTYDVADIAASPADLQDLAAALMTACQPESWSYIGGPGELLPLDRPSRVQVRQTFDAHQEIVRFLRACKELRIALAEESSLGSLVEALSAEDATRCAAASYLLGRLGPRAKPAVPALVELMGDPQAQLAALAVNTLGRIGPAALPELTEAAAGDDPTIAQRAEAAIGQIGAAGRQSMRR